VDALTAAQQALFLLVIGWLPGAVLFRLPLLDRERRVSLEAAERGFWAVVVSAMLSLGVVIALAWAGRYSFHLLVGIDLVVAIAIVLRWRGRLRIPDAPRAGLTALIPVALFALGLWQFSPPSEYVIGGKDPGVYMNEGIQIAQRGTLVIADDTIASVPAFARELFLPRYRHDDGTPRTDYYSLRFMGFFILDPDSGAVVGQFPHLFPASIAIAYGIDGLTGARYASVFWAALGLVAVYFSAARFGRAVAIAAVALMTVHVLQLWYARYPSAEIVMQALLFTALLAADRAIVESDRFFGGVAGLLLGLMMWLRYDVVLAIGAVIAAAAVYYPVRRSLPWTLLTSTIGVTAIALIYLVTIMTGYSAYPLGFTRDWALLPGVAGGAAAAILFWISRSPSRVERLRTAVPVVLATIAIAAAAYAWFVRDAGGRLTIYDAAAFRTFVNLFLTPAAMLAALAGYVYLLRRWFWIAPATLITILLFALFFFYKIRVVPEHFWMDRRFIAAILPGSLICTSAIALSNLYGGSKLRRLISLAIGTTFLALVGRQYAFVAKPVRSHVEYAGVIPRLEALARTIGDDELLLVESRDTSDLHVLAVPLAYVYARNVLVFANPVPDKPTFERFVEWARTRYRTVKFLGSGGTDLVSKHWSAEPMESARFTVPEFERTPWMTRPRGAREKKFDYDVYAIVPPVPAKDAPFELDLGIRDDIHVVRFHAKETTEGHSIRWTGRSSFISFTAMPSNARTLTLWMSDGGRPPSAEPARVEIYLQDQLIGSATIGRGFRPYEFAIPVELASLAAAADVARVRIVSTVWSPDDAFGNGDTRQLGVMLDRMQVR
jgi:hypothetical protein